MLRVSSRWVLVEPLSLLVAALLAAAVIAGPYSFVALLTARVPFTSYVGGIVSGSIAGYILHEFAHRSLSRRYGCISFFKLWGWGVLATLLSLLVRAYGVGLAIIVPGYVVTMCPWGVREPEHIAVAGPAVNIGLGILGVALSLVHMRDFWLGFTVINAWIAFFNLLPLPPLDGYRVLKSKPQLWIAVFALSLLLMYIVHSL